MSAKQKKKEIFFSLGLFASKDQLEGGGKENGVRLTVVAVIAGLVKGGPATVVPGVHRVALAGREHH